MKWDAEKEKEIDIEVGEEASKIILTTLENLAAQERLTLGGLSLYERFSPEEGEKDGS